VLKDDTTVLDQSDSLRRYVPEAIAARVVTGQDLDAHESEVSVLFVDIRGYTTYAEDKSAAEVFSTVNRYGRTHVSEPAMQSFAADAAAQVRARSAAQPTKALSPFNGQQPGYNMRPNAFGVQPTRAINPEPQNNGAKPTTKI